MRHFCVFYPVTALSLGMGVASTSAGLVTLSCCAHAAGALLGCALFAVAVATIAAAAHQHRVAAASAQVASGRWLHRQAVADGGWAGQCLVFREILTPATSPSRARGTTSVGTCDVIGRCRACSELLRQGRFLLALGLLGYWCSMPVKCAHTSIHNTQITGAARHGGVCTRPAGSFQHPHGAQMRIPVEYLCRQISA
jgi:hypothetical protein